MCISGYYIHNYTKKFGQQFGKELPTKREFGNIVDRCAVAVNKDFGDNVLSGFGGDPAHFIAKYSSIDIA